MQYIFAKAHKGRIYTTIDTVSAGSIGDSANESANEEDCSVVEDAETGSGGINASTNVPANDNHTSNTSKLQSAC